MQIQLDRFRRVSELEAIAMLEAARPRTVATIEHDLLRVHATAAGIEHSIRDFWKIRRRIQQRHGMHGSCGACKSERQYHLLRGLVDGLRARRGEIAELNGEVERVECAS